MGKELQDGTQRPKRTSSHMVVCLYIAGPLVGVLLVRALLFGVSIWAPELWKLPYLDPNRRLLRPRKYLEQWPFGLYLEALGNDVTYLWGAGSSPSVILKPHPTADDIHPA